MITCPNCGRRNTNEARNCDNCGTALKEEQTERTELQISSVELPASQSIQSDNATNQSIEQSPSQQIYCSNCGEKLSADANFCWKCGKEVRETLSKRDMLQYHISQILQTQVHLFNGNTKTSFIHGHTRTLGIELAATMIPKFAWMYG